MNAPVFIGPPVELDMDQKIMIALLQSPHYVAEWRHLMQGSMIRMVMSNGAKHTLSKRKVDSLVEEGLLFHDIGGSFVLSMRAKGMAL